MSNLIFILIISIFEAFVVFKFLKFPSSLLVLVMLNLAFIVTVGAYFSPKRSKTLRAEFDKMAPYYDAVADAQKRVSETLEDHHETAIRLEVFNRKLAEFEKAFPNPAQDFQDRPCRDWYLASLTKFRVYSQVASTLANPQAAANNDNEVAELLQKLKTADEAQKAQVKLVGVRVQSLNKSFAHSIIVGFLTWLRMAVTQ